VVEREKLSTVPKEGIGQISNEEKIAIKSLINKVTFDPRNVNVETMNKLDSISCELPDKIRTSLINFKRNPNQYGTILFRNLPTDSDLPNTPEDGNPSLSKQSFISELSLFLFMLYL